MKFPIKYKLASIAFIIIVPILLFGMYHSYTIIEHGKEDIKANNLALATHVANDFDDLINSSFATLRSLAKHPAVINKDSVVCDRLFKELLPSYPDHLNILAVGMDGYNYGSGEYSPGMHKLNYTDREWFVKARKGLNVVGDLHISTFLKTPSAMIAFPVIDSGNKQVGVIGMPLNFTVLHRRTMRFLPRQEGASITVVDSNNHILFCTGLTQFEGQCKRGLATGIAISRGDQRQYGRHGTGRHRAPLQLCRTFHGGLEGHRRRAPRSRLSTGLRVRQALCHNPVDHQRLGAHHFLYRINKVDE